MAKAIISSRTKTGPQLGFEDPRYALNGFAGFGFWNGYEWEPEPERWGNVNGYDYWRRWYRTVYRMKLDPTIALLRQMFIAPIVAAGWTVKAEDDVPEEMIDYAKEEMESIRVDLMRTAGLGCCDYGWAPFEKVFHYRPDGLIGVKKLKSLLQSMTLIEWDEDTGAFTGLKQEKVTLSLEESLLFAFDVEGTDWYGNGILQAVRRCLQFHSSD